ncbi:MAG TPA: MFS transporter [Polyangiales bacterium]|nr:MFS transporter [Polyangiales bacterium]
MRLSLADALFYALMVGAGEVYFLADAVRLGATSLEQALVITLPLCVGTLGPLMALGLLGRFRRRKAVVVSAATLQALILFTIVLTDTKGTLSPRVLIGLASAYQMCAQAAGTAWASWYGDLVPARVRGRYFATRNRIAQVATSGSLIVAGLLLQRLEPGSAGTVAPGAGGLGYAIIFGGAGLFRLVSAVLLALSPEPPAQLLSDRRETLSFARSDEALPVRRILLFAAALQLTVYMASPYFGPFMLEELRLSYTEYMAGSLAVVVLKFASLPSWGRLIDRYGARAAFLLAVVLVALVPLPWLWVRGVAMVIVAQALSGLSWGGHEVSQFSLLLETSHARSRLHVFAMMSVFTGVAQLTGSLLGGWLLMSVDRNFLVVFVVSAACRLGVALAAPAIIPASIGTPGIGRRRLFLRLLGFRASGGMESRPMPVDDIEGS